MHELGERLLPGGRGRVRDDGQHGETAGTAGTAGLARRGGGHRYPAGGEQRTGRGLHGQRAGGTEGAEVDAGEQVLTDLRVALDADGGLEGPGRGVLTCGHTGQCARRSPEDDDAPAVGQRVTHLVVRGRGRLDDEDVGRLGGGGHATAAGQCVGEVGPVADDGHEGKQAHEGLLSGDTSALLPC